MNVVLKAPDDKDCTGVSWNGAWYEVVDGYLTVPKEAIPELTRPIHGFVVSTEPTPKTKKRA
jgi:hypothetical protein